MNNLALKTTTSCGLRTKIGEKSNQFLPSFFAQFYRCKCSSNDDHGVKIALRQNLEKNGRQEMRVWGKGPVAKHRIKYRVKRRKY